MSEIVKFNSILLSSTANITINIVGKNLLQSFNMRKCINLFNDTLMSCITFMQQGEINLKYFSLEFIERIVSRIEIQIKKVKFKTIMQWFSQAYIVNIVTNIRIEFLLEKQHHYQRLSQNIFISWICLFYRIFGYHLGWFKNI